MATSLHPHSSNPFRDPNRTPAVTPQATGTSTTSLNPFLHPAERVTPQATGASQYFTPQPTGTLSPQATGAHSTAAPIETQNTGSYYTPTSSNSGAESTTSYAPPTSPPPSATPTPSSPPRSTYVPPEGPPPQRYAPPSGPPPQPRAPSPTPTINVEPPPPYTPAADVRHGEIPLETGPRRAYAPEWHPDGRTWRNEHVPAPTSPSPPATRTETQWDSLAPTWRRPSASASSPNLATQQAGSNSSWREYPGLARHGTTVRPPPRHPSQPLERANTTVGTGPSRVGPGPPTTTPTPGRALLHNGKVLAYPAQYECNKCHLTGYVAYDPSNPCRECWSLFAQPYEGVLSFAPWDSPESVTSDEQNLQRPLPSSSSPRPQSRPQPPSANSSRPVSHPQHSSYGSGHPFGSLPPAGWSSSSSLRPSATVSYGRPPRGALVVRPGDPRIGGRVCWKCSGDGWQYKTMGLETKTCSACNGLGRLF